MPARGNRSTWFLAALLTLPAASLAQDGFPDGPPRPVRTVADVDALIIQLDRDETRLPALEQLFVFARMHPLQVGSISVITEPRIAEMSRRAADAIEAHTTPALIERALFSSSPSLQVWAMWQLSYGEDKKVNPLKRLVPRLRELAEHGALDPRANAQEQLAVLEDQSDFLKRLIPTETYPDNVLQLISSTIPFIGGGFEKSKAQRDPLFNVQLLRLLNHPDPDVRRDALVFISSNDYELRAEDLRVNLNETVFLRAMELSHSKDGRERSYALWALNGMRAKHPDAVLGLALDLADDPSEDVRSTVASVLDHWKDRPKVCAALDRLRQDPSPSVRFSAIMTLGATDHIEELREIADDDDEQTTRWARYTLERLEAAP